MGYRTRLILAFAAVVLVPLAVIAFGIRKEMRDRLVGQYERRVASLVSIIADDLDQEGFRLAGRLATLKAALIRDNRFRLAAVQRIEAERPYLLDLAGDAMRLTGLAMLQIQDDGGRILSSGHFRNEYDRQEPELPAGLMAAGGMALIRARAPEGPFLVLARADSFRVAGRRFTLVGGVAADRRFLSGLTRDAQLAVSLVTPGAALSTDPELEAELAGEASGGPPDSARDVIGGGARPERVVRVLPIPFVDTDGGEGRVVPARLLVTHPLTPLDALRRSIDIWFAVAALVTGLVAFLLAGWLSSRMSRPLIDLARKTAEVDLDRLDVNFSSERTDEIGALSRLLGVMTERLRASAARLREAERRATIGDLARQVNHDIKNGLVPIRNVFRHLSQLVRETPEELPVAWRERQSTIESGISYLENLATNYARLSPKPDRRPCDVNAIVREVARYARGVDQADLHVSLADGLPAVLGDPVALRRILENLIANALDSLGSRSGRVSISTETADGDGENRRVLITVADTGRGLSHEESERIFDDFYTTKRGGTGLGLSIVRRLVLDLNGKVRVESEPGRGARFMVELPAVSADAAPQPMRSGGEERP